MLAFANANAEMKPNVGKHHILRRKTWPTVEFSFFGPRRKRMRRYVESGITFAGKTNNTRCVPFIDKWFPNWDDWRNNGTCELYHFLSSHCVGRGYPIFSVFSPSSTRKSNQLSLLPNNVQKRAASTNHLPEWKHCSPSMSRRVDCSHLTSNDSTILYRFVVHDVDVERVAYMYNCTHERYWVSPFASIMRALTTYITQNPNMFNVHVLLLNYFCLEVTINYWMLESDPIS